MWQAAEAATREPVRGVDLSGRMSEVRARLERYAAQGLEPQGLMALARTIVFNMATDVLRTRQGAVAHEGPDPVARDVDATEVRARVLFRAALDRALANMIPADRGLIGERLLRGRTWQEIARARGEDYHRVRRHGLELLDVLREELERTSERHAELAQWLRERGTP